MGGDGGAREGWGGSAEGDTEAAEQPPGWRLEEIREIKGQRGWRGAGPDGDGEYSTERGQAGWKMGVEDGLGAARVVHELLHHQHRPIHDDDLGLTTLILKIGRAHV